MIAENVEYLVLAEASGVNWMWRAVEGLKQGEPPPEATKRGLSIESIIERTWKPRELAPPMAAPEFGGPLDYWVVALWAGQAVLAALGRELETVVFPPFGRGFFEVWGAADQTVLSASGWRSTGRESWRS